MGRQSGLSIVCYRLLLPLVATGGGNDDKTLHKAFRNTYEGYAMVVVQHSLLVQLIIVLTRMHDPVGRQPSDRASMPRLMSLLSDHGVAQIFIDRSKAWPGSEHFQLADRNARVVAEKLDRARILYDQLRAEEYPAADDGKTWLKALRDYRDHFVAHSLLQTPPDPARYGYIGDLLRRTAQMIEALRLAISGIHAEPSQTEEIWKRHADHFWRRVMKGFDPRILADEQNE